MRVESASTSDFPNAAASKSTPTESSGATSALGAATSNGSTGNGEHATEKSMEPPVKNRAELAQMTDDQRRKLRAERFGTVSFTILSRCFKHLRAAHQLKSIGGGEKGGAR
jgi:hypothetical protein